MANNATRTIGFNLPGGTVNFVDSALNLGGHSGNFFDFAALGASVTAEFGGSFPDLAAINTAIGNDIHFISSTSLGLEAVDNQDGTFTVSAIPEPSVALLLGSLGAIFLLRRPCQCYGGLKS